MNILAQHLEKRGDNIDTLAAAAPKPCLALLLAGGDGTRLQEFTAQLTGVPIPKQYCPLMRGRSLLELTLSRTRYFAPIENTRVIINQNHLGLARDQLQALPESSIFVQPENRDTGPGMIFALVQIARTNPDTTVAVFPTDHFIDDDKAFIAHVLRAACLVHQFPQKMAILGVTPNHPETGYGYIMPGRPLHTTLTPWGVSHVKAFEEKPSSILARKFISQGGLWNTFVMVFQLKRVLGLLRDMAPRDSQRLLELPDDLAEVPAIYRDISPWNFSSHILARIPEELIVLEAPDIRWSDWGTRESIERTYRHMNLVPAWRPLDYDSEYGAA
ncbi:MAG: putative Mannose-1-phosphate guanylyltransferase [Acidobacteria bacterium]|nr:putative Mannose-1-phosphate guanylyltransferase [Acidobacteriota bacterium]